ncbi:MAG TPA: 2-oxoacid:ferredoxin oxidoreductase subunit beta, partial [Candidatus Limnocylindria bacterium]|nr:2-oxoacid:ferredoxin oxidoreductase subunit beta [Candidatus Limnocylindria bacterium]
TKEWYAGEDIGRPRLRRLDTEPDWDPVVKDPDDPDEIVAKKVRALQASYETVDRLAVGLFYAVELPTYDDQLAAKVPALKDHPLVDLPVFQRDVTPLFKELE